MQINRLFEIVYIILERKLVTAKELAARFEVSQRTIYRDIEVLSAAGIPIYTNKGKGGGISLLDNFVLNKSMLSEKEQIDILASVQGLGALNVSDVEPVLKKLAAIFNKSSTSWIDVDFSNWSSCDEEKEKFNILKKTILDRTIVNFDYYSSNGEKTQRKVEPIKILFKGQSWYIYGFCRIKEDYRVFKLNRINNLTITEESFQRNIPKNPLYDTQYKSDKTVRITMKIEDSMAFRVYDEFDRRFIERNEDGSFIVSADLPESEWLYGYIMSYGDSAEVLEPKYIRANLKRMLEESLKKYI